MNLVTNGPRYHYTLSLINHGNLLSRHDLSLILSFPIIQSLPLMSTFPLVFTIMHFLQLITIISWFSCFYPCTGMWVLCGSGSSFPSICVSVLSVLAERWVWIDHHFAWSLEKFDCPPSLNNFSNQCLLVCLILNYQECHTQGLIQSVAFYISL